MRSSILLFIAMFAWNSVVSAEMRSEKIEYKQGNTVLEGYLVYDTSFEGKRPGVLVVHEWWGRNNYVEKRAEQLAKLGYVAFAVDIYGKGVLAKSPKEAGDLSKKYKDDRTLMRARVNAGLNVLKGHKLTDASRLAAIGYCFGGTTVLELARSGAQVSGVVSFHGGLDTPSKQDAKNIKAKVLVLHGGDDPYVPHEQVLSFEDEMRSAGVDWQLMAYGDAVHSFSNPDSGNDKSKGAAYNEKADRRSWEAMKVFFAEIFRQM